MKKILSLVIMLMIYIFVSSNNSYAFAYTQNYYNQNYSYGCTAGSYGAYSYPYMSEGETYKYIAGNKTTTLLCKNGYVSASISYDNTYDTSYDYYYDYSNSYNNSSSCPTGRYGNYSYPSLSHLQTYNIVIGNTTTTLVCNNGNVKVQNTYSNNYNNNYNYNYDNTYSNYYNNSNTNSTCSSGRYGAYSYPNLTDGQTYSTTSGNTTVSLICQNGNVSIQNTYTKNNNTNYNNYNNNACSSGRYGAYSYPNLTDGQTYSTTSGNTTVSLICQNGNVSIQNKYSNYNDNNYNYSNGSCSANSYGSYSYPNLTDGQTYTNKKTISGGQLITKLKCSNGNVSVIDTYSKCLHGYESYGNSCYESYYYRY
ncbi:MAG: hypothetical protein PHS49_07850 [Candidatus Gracilibacteria bacterium]|nr:hypothetical protein [Candidatus Gracilibacteria bacterium]